MQGDDNAVNDVAIERIAGHGHPVITIQLEDTYDVGAEFFRWQMATAVLGHLLGVNPFDEPDVKAAKDATAQFEKIQKDTEAEIIESDKLMLEERNKLIEQQSVIAPEAFEIKAKDYEKKLQNYQSEKQNKLRKLEGILQNARNEILEKVKPILEELSKDIGVTVILEKNSVLLSASNMDITDEVVRKLNKELPKIKVSLD